MRTTYGLVVTACLLTGLVGCGSGSQPRPTTTQPRPEADAPSSMAAPELPDFSVADMLAELPTSVRTTGAFTLYAADLVEASELAGLDLPSDAEAAADWVANLNGRVKDGEVLPAFVPFAIPLASTSPAPLVEQDLGWSVADIVRFTSWTSRPDRACTRAECSELTTTVAAGRFDDATLSALPESGGIRSAGEGPDLSTRLENRTPARPAGTPLRMAVDDEWLVASPYSGVVRDWQQGRAQSLADDPTLISMARSLDRNDAYAAMIAAPASAAELVIPQRVFTSLGYSPEDFPVFDAFAIGWSVVDGEPEFTVVYHVPRQVAAGAVADDVADSWGRPSLGGRDMWSLLRAKRIRIVDGNVVVKANPAPGTGPNVPFLMVEAGDVPFLTR